MNNLSDYFKSLRKDVPESGDTMSGMFEELQSEREYTDNALRTLAPVEAPAELALSIRLALSHERVRAERRFLGRVQFWCAAFFENSIKPIGLQAAVATVALLAAAGGVLMLGAVAPQQAVEANDAPLAGFSAPRYLYSVAGEQAVGGIGDQPLIVEARVDPAGRVYAYHVISGALDAAASAALQQRMVTGVFQPAKVFGEPVRGSVLLTFADVVVRG
ncbi:MAG: hypothetical protein ACRYF4_11325 [Janthinobacterium lividum]